MLYDQLTFHKIYYHKFQLTGGIVWQLGALLRNLVVIWMSFTTCDTSLLNRSRPVLLMKYCHKKTTKSHSQYNLYPLEFNWTWLVSAYYLWQIDDKVSNWKMWLVCEVQIYPWFILLFPCRHVCAAYMVVYDKIKKNNNKKNLNWTAKHPNLVTFHF